MAENDMAIRKGDVIGVFTVIRELPIAERRKRAFREFEVTCNHGKTHFRTSYQLCKTFATRCGKCNREKSQQDRMRRIDDILNKREYNGWIVVFDVKTKRGNVSVNSFLCKCACCGEKRTIRTVDLLASERVIHCSGNVNRYSERKYAMHPGNTPRDEYAVWYVNQENRKEHEQGGTKKL